jgi:hypothetical protein
MIENENNKIHNLEKKEGYTENKENLKKRCGEVTVGNK